jgi:hypothetical protein
MTLLQSITLLITSPLYGVRIPRESESKSPSAQAVILSRLLLRKLSYLSHQSTPAVLDGSLSLRTNQTPTHNLYRETVNSEK